MRTKTILLAPIALLTLTLAPAACVHVAADVDTDQDIGFDLPDFGTTCAGSGMSQNDSGMTMWTKTPIEGRCQIDFSWGGTLIDMVKVRTDADAKGQGAKLTIQSIDLGFQNVALLDQGGNNITPPQIPDWEAHFAVGDQPVADFGGTDITSLLAMPLSFTAPPAVLQAAANAFAKPEALTGNASARLVVEMTDLPALAEAAGPHIQFHFTAHVEADAKKDLL